ncbi:hypothetical protein Btru_070371 [Bulinus truncatus]|nr:hypothetical protein Btru_070371 [Bulinus truncatus]
MWLNGQVLLEDLATVPGVTLSTTPVQTTPTWLADSDDHTCNVDQNIRSLRLLWNTTYPFTWMRVKLNNSIYRLEIRVDFRLANNVTASCNGLVTLLDSTTADYRCDLNETVQELTVTGTGLKSLCSLYVSGGRNVALKQTATQTSTYGNYPALLAVDGNTSRYFESGSCSHTGDRDPYSSWTLTLDSAKSIQRFLLYNRDDRFSERLKHFKLETLDSSNNVVWNYNDTRESLAVYTVSSLKSNNVSKLRIYPTYIFPGEPNTMLTLCEVELYGECAPGLWGLGCNIICPWECSNWCHKDTGQCPSCFGYSDPPLCKTECKVSTWGHNCENTCSTKCIGRTCNTVTGLCEANCNRLSCPSDCPQGFYGENCTLECSSTCKDFTCSDYGYCVSCLPGFEGNFCEKAKKDNSRDITYQEGIGIGFAACAVCSIIVCVVVVIVVCRRRMKQPKTKGRRQNVTSRETKFQSYDGVKQINVYQHSYESASMPGQSNVSTAAMEITSHGTSPHYENHSVSIYETINENVAPV